LTIEDIRTQIAQTKETSDETPPRTWSDQREKAYVAGWCFRCMEGPFESLEWVISVTNGYIWGTEQDAQYNKVASGKTQHREAVEIVYDPALISYKELLETYRRQIDPTDAGGQFADRWPQYHTAIYYSTPEEQQQATESKQQLADSKKFNKPIVVEIFQITAFYPAEEYHQDYYKKNSDHYNSYAKWSGRKWYIEQTWKDSPIPTKNSVTWKTKKPKSIAELTDTQRNILFEWGTEPAFNNAYWDNHEAGIYVDVIDGTPLFSSTDKFDSGTGRPSFSKPIDQAMVSDKTDNSLWITRTEITSSTSNGHLWHVFTDGPKSLWGIRYCINSAALEFIPVAQFDALWYSEYKKLFTQ
jgi:peptide methionine sulfoxide reductase msrA/msrB